jgi:hypothetical protein
MSSNPFDFPRDEPPRRRPRRRRPVGFSWLLGVVIAGAVVGGMFVFSTILDRMDNPPALSPKNDPYKTDCAIIRRWLRDRYGEVEVVSWGNQTLFHSQHFGDTTRVTVRFRVKGHHAIQSGAFHIDASNQVVYSVID